MTTLDQDIPRKIAEIQFTNGVWTDVSPYLVKDITVNRGSTRVDSPVVRYEPGKGNIRLNNSDRRFDPTHLLGPYVSGGKTQVTAMRPLRILMEWAGVTYPLFTGYVDLWDVTWISDIYSEVSVPATDGFKVLSNKRRVAVAPVGAGENSGARITRILNSAGWPAGERNIATGDSTMQATTLEGAALDELLNVAEGEIGEFYISADGLATFRNRQALLLEERSASSQGTFGTHEGIIAPFLVKLNTDDATLWNEVIATRSGGTTQTVSDSTSIAELQFAKTYSKSNLPLADDSTVANYASWILFISKDPEIRFDSIVIKPMGDPYLYFPQVLSREIGDRITITRRPPGGGEPITRDAFIRGIQHKIDQRDWSTTWLLQSASKYGAFLTLDDPITGMLDSGYAYGY